jgi:hypothetical protein
MCRLIALIVLPVALLLGCDQEAMMEKFTPKEEAAYAKEVIGKLVAKDFAGVEAALAPRLQSAQLRAQLEEMARLVPAGQAKSVRTVGAHTMTTSSHTTFDLTFEYEYPEVWVVANAVVERRDGKVVVQGLHFTPNKQSLEEMNRFTFAGKGALHYIVFALAVAIPLLVLYAFVACVRTKPLSRKWLWLLFIAVGLVQFRFNWSTGAWGVQPISFALFGAGFAKQGPVAPLVFTLAFPLGAVLFLAKHRRPRAVPDDA